MTRVFQHHRPFVVVSSRFAGDRGVGLYLSPPDAAGSELIRFRNTRLYPSRDCLGVYVGEYQPGGEDLLNDATLAVVKEPATELEYTLPAEYLVEGTTFWAQLRVHEDGLEDDTLYRPRQFVVGPAGEAETILGTAAVIRKVKLDGGGLRLVFEYVASLSGPQPESFLIRKISGTGTIADVEVSAVLGQRDYSADVAGLTGGAAYVFELLGVFDGEETSLISGITFTADAAGPTVLTVSYEEET